MYARVRKYQKEKDKETIQDKFERTTRTKTPHGGHTLIARDPFPTLGLKGDYIFTYNLSKRSELEDLDNEMWLKEYKRKRRAHIQEVVHASMLTEQEKE